MKNQYDGYAVTVSDDPSYYGPECTAPDAQRIASDLAAMIEREFPGITVNRTSTAGTQKPVSGPDAETCEAIRVWVEQNWTAAL